MQKNKSGAVLIFLASLLWAGDGPFRKPLLVAGLSVGFVACLEHLFNLFASLPGLFKSRGEFKKLTAKHYLGLCYIGAGASALAAVLFVKGAVAMNYNFTIAALLQKLQPLFAIALSAIFLKEKINLKFWLAVVPALCGAYLVSFGLAHPSQIVFGLSGVSWFGPFFAVLAALLWAGGTVVGRALLWDLDFKFVTAGRFFFGLLFLIFFVKFSSGFEFGQMNFFLWRNTGIIALLTGFFALLLYYYGLKSTKASVATLMELGYPLALTLVNWKFLGIALSAWQIFGALLLLVTITILVLKSTNEVPLDNQKV